MSDPNFTTRNHLFRVLSRLQRDVFADAAVRSEVLKVVASQRASGRLVVLADDPALPMDNEAVDNVGIATADTRRSAVACSMQQGALAVELSRDKIRVNCVCPALVDTEMADRFRSTMSAAQFAEYLTHYPMGIGRPEDVANAIAFLIADTARWMTGSSLLLDGGLLAG